MFMDRVEANDSIARVDLLHEFPQYYNNDNEASREGKQAKSKLNDPHAWPSCSQRTNNEKGNINIFIWTDKEGQRAQDLSAKRQYRAKKDKNVINILSLAVLEIS